VPCARVAHSTTQSFPQAPIARPSPSHSPDGSAAPLCCRHLPGHRARMCPWPTRGIVGRRLRLKETARCGFRLATALGLVEGREAPRWTSPSTEGGSPRALNISSLGVAAVGGMGLRPPPRVALRRKTGRRSPTARYVVPPPPHRLAVLPILRPLPRAQVAGQTTTSSFRSRLRSGRRIPLGVTPRSALPMSTCRRCRDAWLRCEDHRPQKAADRLV